ncbi:sensor histidine kinase [[Clostridium] sordellii]|uniref:histidine kinase n=1 Tax=Paraclostridium sordellii TaxID=1505 RepID=A0ABM9RN11_PARSO|nr:HAMP domain-containing sensor histidine kinase [Paeniclostridium sordellii]CEJ73191.1 histidine kinase-, DNA gyrase B-, and HSP90-likeATPase family protein [[Clostridium] sordellii] [Paeniclostridium sordellii]CEN68744.1 sensor histidine kinase [[Clostridium] sordellii] [Paeniclostridium sordellii]CEN72011.1 sensor histidine kinase [[Clostridium] sordellii] [Paeniclostridium sordellii]CEO22916.1 sensor histidine kinase [[Clostridium] sordellii] [Paeniclostridium sordellii]CEP76396.1 sensor 
MRRVRDKTAIVLVAYSVISLIIFIFGASYIVDLFGTNDLRKINSEIYPDIYTETSEYTLSTSNEDKVKDTQLMDSYKNKFNSKYILVIMLFFIFTIISNLLLLFIFKKFDIKNRREIANNIKSIEDEEEILTLDPIMSKVYKELKDKFDSHIEDYKRLNSYLSHEQKNAISILRTNLEINKNDELINILDKVTDNIEDVLAISDVKSDDEMYEIDIALVCAQVCDHYKKVYDKISFNFEEDENMNIYGKEKWIYRGISNLIDNAIKYGEGKEIDINVKNEKGSVIVSVKDNGIGMSKSSMRKIFDNRYRVNELNKDGYGIGLSLVKHVCDLCNGFVWLESEENKGSTFYLVFKEFK